MIFAFVGIVYPWKALKKRLDLVNACRGVLMWIFVRPKSPPTRCPRLKRSPSQSEGSEERRHLTERCNDAFVSHPKLYPGAKDARSSRLFLLEFYDLADKTVYMNLLLLSWWFVRLRFFRTCCVPSSIRFAKVFLVTCKSSSSCVWFWCSVCSPIPKGRCKRQASW